VVFGHMHCNLRYPSGRRRRMVIQDSTASTIYLNTAEVPRVRSAEAGGHQQERQHHFVVVEIQGKAIASIESIWVGVTKGTHECRIVQTQHLIRDTEQGRQVWNDFTGGWDEGAPGTSLARAGSMSAA
jgi:uncharacterized protein (TIGR04168 family)